MAEAARVAEEDGFDRLTVAAVAERLGVKLPSLYKHIAGLDEVRLRLAVLAVIGLGDASPPLLWAGRAPTHAAGTSLVFSALDRSSKT